MPSDLQSLLAGLFGLITTKNKFDSTIQRKQVEDFHIAFNTNADVTQDFVNKYRSVISKYSLCDIGDIRHGKVCKWGW